MKYIYIIYQALVALPLLIGVTILAALVTILAIPWANAEWVHKVQMFWARCFCWLLFTAFSWCNFAISFDSFGFSAAFFFRI